MKKGLLLLTFLTACMSSAVHADDAAIKATLGKLGMNNAEVQSTAVKGLSAVSTDSGTIYITEDGKHVLQGPMYDVSGTHPVNVTNKALVKKLDALQSEMIIYKAKNEKHVITVFTDITCGYCHKLHQQMQDYNDLGITVRYLAFPRQGLNSQTEKDMQSIWCTGNRKTNFDAAMRGDAITPATCATSIAKHFELGVQFGVTGTPAVVLEDGTLIPGYQPPKEMAAMLDQQDPSHKTGG
ncbi:bifunctional protein-disulfide isomerase/oxidoreductase DsbC [Rahnella ecdela]|uniref:Thiol:disulfide interchange protein n=1 Tax=Rahnella ecdela TaxID=2816250 RepID=A0ABS6LER3_9GAMM|nr:bifunctional protein-disulfide isomerase/oxidoreductase DsbC [Rahnella ecdela]MBU9845407.1 bifunctional protein-disulfide isomerase/oxidoreductase DsbC [Rahnella ecdela]